jgi:hypothetical protein
MIFWLRYVMLWIAEWKLKGYLMTWDLFELEELNIAFFVKFFVKFISGYSQIGHMDRNKDWWDQRLQWTPGFMRHARRVRREFSFKSNTTEKNCLWIIWHGDENQFFAGSNPELKISRTQNTSEWTLDSKSPLNFSCWKF